MLTFTISAELAESILNYLATKPYIEVHQLITDLQRMPRNEKTPEN